MLVEELSAAFDAAGFKVANNTKGITKDKLLVFIASKQSVTNGGLGYTSAGGINKFLRSTFPSKFDGSYPRGMCYIQFILLHVNKLNCTKCDSVKSITEFHKNHSNTTKHSDYCASCMRGIRKEYYKENSAKEIASNNIRRLQMLCRVPLWADEKAIARIYANRPDGYHVDHIIPINGELVCGLHVENNLQYLTAQENLSKSNKFNIE